MRELEKPESIESLNVLDLDIEALEQRLDMMNFMMPMGYTCGADGNPCGVMGSCGQNNPTPSPKPQPVPN